jgi:hypothetical protein
VLEAGPIAVLGAATVVEATFTEAALRAQHALVVDLAQKVDPLIPVRFATRMTPDRIRAAVLRSKDALVEALHAVKGRQQMTLRLIGAPVIDPSLIAGRSGSSYLQQRRAAYSIPSELDPVLAAVMPFVTDQRGAPGRGGVRATVFHLVKRADVAKYKLAAARAAEIMPPGSVTVTGPWPPFAFAPELNG